MSDCANALPLLFTLLKVQLYAQKNSWPRHNKMLQSSLNSLDGKNSPRMSKQEGTWEELPKFPMRSASDERAIDLGRENETVWCESG